MRVRILVAPAIGILYHNVDELPGNHNHLLDGLPVDVLLHGWMGEHDVLHRLAVGFPGHANVGALLAVYLYHELALVLDQRRGVGFWPGSREDVLAKSQLSP